MTIGAEQARYPLLANKSLVLVDSLRTGLAMQGYFADCVPYMRFTIFTLEKEFPQEVEWLYSIYKENNADYIAVHPLTLLDETVANLRVRQVARLPLQSTVVLGSEDSPIAATRNMYKEMSAMGYKLIDKGSSKALLLALNTLAQSNSQV